MYSAANPKAKKHDSLPKYLILSLLGQELSAFAWVLVNNG